MALGEVIAHIEKIFEVLGCADEFKARLASYKFEGDDLNWWKAFKQAKGGETYVATLSWKDFRDIFFLQYFPRLAGFVGKKTGPPEEQAKHFKWALCDWILDEIVNTKFIDVAQVANAARNMEILSERSSQNNKRNRDGDRIRQTARDNNQRGQKRYPNYASSPPCDICGKLYPSKACHRVTGACFTCGSTGHMARDCPKNGGNGGRGDENDNQPATKGRVFSSTKDQAANSLELVDCSSCPYGLSYQSYHLFGEEVLIFCLRVRSLRCLFVKGAYGCILGTLFRLVQSGMLHSDCHLPLCNDFSPINVSEKKSVTFSKPFFDYNDDFTSSDDESLSDEDVSKNNVKIYSNPLFKFDDEYISSDVNPLFDEVLEDIESEDSYVSKLDEPDFLVTPLSKLNEDECFDPGGDVDEIKLLLHRDPSNPKISNEWKKILYDAPSDDLMTEDKVFDLEILEKFFSPTYVSLPFEDRHYLSLTYVIRIFLPYFTYLVESPFLLSSGSEDTIFDPDISTFHFSSLEPVASHRSGTFMCFNVHPNILNESPMEICSSTCFDPNIMMIWVLREEARLFLSRVSCFVFYVQDCPDYEDSRARGFVHRSLDLPSLACNGYIKKEKNKAKMDKSEHEIGRVQEIEAKGPRWQSRGFLLATDTWREDQGLIFDDLKNDFDQGSRFEDGGASQRPRRSALKSNLCPCLEQRTSYKAIKENNDLGVFVLPIRIEAKFKFHDLADTGSNINVTPDRIYAKLGRDQVKPMTNKITMLDHFKAKPIGILKDMLCQVGVTIIILKFLILDIHVDRDVLIVVGRSFLCTCGSILNTIKGTTSTLDGVCHQNFYVAQVRNNHGESDSDDEEEYYMKRDDYGKPFYGPNCAKYLSCDDPIDRTLALQETLNTLKKIYVWKKMIAFLRSLPVPLKNSEWIPSYSDNFVKKGDGDGTNNYEVGSSSRLKRTQQHETMEEAMLPHVHHDFLH
ncbi:replication protein A 70 kDa DNA-binding subunit B [Tanacetum coccineum]